MAEDENKSKKVVLNDHSDILIDYRTSLNPVLNYFSET